MFAADAGRRHLATVITAALVFLATGASASRFHFQTLTPEQGLAATAAYQIDQDETGYLWFATTEGVSRFDGIEFRNFDVSTGMTDQRAYSMVRDGEGHIWIGTADGLSIFDGWRVKSLSTSDGVPRGVIWSMSRDGKGRIWLGTQGGGLLCWDGTRFRRFTTREGLPEDFVYGVFADSRDRLWIGTRNRGIAVAKIESNGDIRMTGTFPPETIHASAVRDFVEDGSGNVYAATRGGGVVRFDATTATPSGVALPGEDTYQLLISRGGELVIGTSFSGLVMVTLPDLRPRLYVGEADGLPSGEIYSMFEDREGNLWIGTGAGVVRWTGEAIRNFDRTDGLAGTYVLGVSTDGDRAVWVATAQGATRLEFDEQNPYKFRTTSLRVENGLLGREVWQVLRDRSGKLWIATANGLCLYTEGKGCRNWTTAEGLPDNYVTCLAEDQDGAIWAGMAGGVARLTDVGTSAERVVAIRGDAVFGGSNIYAIEPGRDGTIWIATDMGLFSWNGSLRNWGPRDGIPPRSINDLVADKDGSLWIATSGYGVIRWVNAMNPDEAPRLDIAGTGRGLPSNAVLSIVPGDDGTVWAGTPAGVCQIDSKLLANGSRSVVLRQLTTAGGLIGSEPGSGGSFCRAPDGSFWFGLSRGVSHYVPSREVRYSISPRVEIGSVSVGGRQIYAAAFDRMNAGGGAPGNQQGARLAHDSGSLAFEYRGLSFRDPTRLTYQVRLDGFDADWAAPTRSRTKEYTNLPPGDYTFRVRASNAEGIPSEADAVYRFTITAPFWLKTWFYLALAAFVLVVVLCFYRWRTRTFERLNRELESLVAARTSALESRTRELEEANLKIVESDRAKSRFLASTSHELRTPLNSILGFSELLTEQIGSISADRARKFAGNVQLSARHLLALINDILDLSKIEAGKMEVHVERNSLRPLVDSVLETIHGFAAPRRVHVVADVSDELPVVFVDGVKVRQILYNLLSNAVKFSMAEGTVELAIFHREAEVSPLEVDSIEIVVADHGSGIRQEDLKSIFEEFRQTAAVSKLGIGTGLGLAIARQFAELQGGTIQAESAPGQGSTFRVWLPVDSRAYDTDFDSGPFRAIREDAAPGDPGA